MSLALGTAPTIGKIMRGIDKRKVTIRLAPFIGVVRRMVEEICLSLLPRVFSTMGVLTDLWVQPINYAKTFGTGRDIGHAALLQDHRRCLQISQDYRTDVR